MATADTTPLPGFSYYHPRPGTTVTAKEGFVTIPIDLPIPLLDEDFASLSDAALPDYDMVGRGIYGALRKNPDILHASRYAAILRDGYSHYLAELGSLIIMLDRKDVDPLYLDRKITYLKIFRLLEPDNHRLPFEIGSTYHRKGRSLDACRQISYNFFMAEKFLLESWEMSPGDREVAALLAEVSYILGRYGRAAELWGGIGSFLEGEESRKVMERIERIERGDLPFVPVVDYLEATAVAFDLAERKEYEEAAAILSDIMEDTGFRDGYPFPEIWYLLGSCHEALSSPEMAISCYREAVAIRPDYDEAVKGLQRLGRG